MIVTIILLIAIYILNIIDCAQTIYAVQLFGIGIEANPIARFMFEHNCALVPKLLVVLAALVLMGIIIRYDKRFIWVAYCLLIFYIFVVINNFVVLLQLGVFL